MTELVTPEGFVIIEVEPKSWSSYWLNWWFWVQDFVPSPQTRKQYWNTTQELAGSLLLELDPDHRTRVSFP